MTNIIEPVILLDVKDLEGYVVVETYNGEPNTVTIETIEAICKRSNLRYRILEPMSITTMDWKHDRVNITIGYDKKISIDWG